MAALGKLADREGTRRAAGDLGAPERLVGPVAVALPLAELGVAALLLPASTAVAGALGGLTLLTAFTAALALAFARGRTPDCHCFGQLRSAPVSWKTFARNGLLAGLAVLAVAAGWNDPGPSAGPWAALLAPAGIAAWAVLRRRGAGEPAERPPEVGLSPGTAAPAFSLRDLHGETVSLDDLLVVGKPVLLLFGSPASRSCRELLSSVAEWQRYESYALTVALVSSGDEEATRKEAEEHALERVLLDPERTVRDAYRAGGTPSAVLVSSHGTIGSWLAPGREWIERLVERAAEDEEEPVPQWLDGLPIGEPMPSTALPDLRGAAVQLEELVRDETVFLFWRPGCRPCRGLYERVLAWEGQPPAEAPRLVVISLGSAEETASERFRSPILLDEELAASDAFRAGGAPMAVRVDGERRIASRIAVGADAVLSLLQA